MNQELNTIKKVAENNVSDLKNELKALYNYKSSAETVGIEKALKIEINKIEAQLTVHRGYIKLIEELTFNK